MNSFEEWLKAKYTLEDRMTNIGLVADLRQAYRAGMMRAAEIVNKIEVQPGSCNSDSELTNSHTCWKNGTYDACEQVTAAIRKEVGYGSN